MWPVSDMAQSEIAGGLPVEGGGVIERGKTLRAATLELGEASQDRDVVIDGAILALWNNGLDTYDIARKLSMSETVRESDVANRLARLRDGQAS